LVSRGCCRAADVLAFSGVGVDGVAESAQSRSCVRLVVGPVDTAAAWRAAVERSGSGATAARVAADVVVAP
jgi:hypothetical protein